MDYYQRQSPCGKIQLATLPAWTHAEQQQISKAAIMPTSSVWTKANFEFQQSSTPAFYEFYLSISASSLRREWFMLLAFLFFYFIFLHRPRWGVENWICPNSHAGTHSCTHAKKVFGTAKVSRITHNLTLPSLCKSKTGQTNLFVFVWFKHSNPLYHRLSQLCC